MILLGQITVNLLAASTFFLFGGLSGVRICFVAIVQTIVMFFYNRKNKLPHISITILFILLYIGCVIIISTFIAMVRVDDIFKLKQRKEAKEQAQIQLQEQTKTNSKKSSFFYFISYMVRCILFRQFHITIFYPALFAHKFRYKPIQNSRQYNHQQSNANIAEYALRIFYQIENAHKTARTHTAARSAAF